MACDVDLLGVVISRVYKVSLVGCLSFPGAEAANWPIAVVFVEEERASTDMFFP